MEPNNVISLQAVKELRNTQHRDLAYENVLKRMDKLELLEEMTRFQEERSKIGRLTLSLMVRGKALFKLLEQFAETQEFLALVSSYRRHLEYELAAYLKRKVI